MKSQEFIKPPKIISIKGPNDNEAALSPERGGIITSMVLSGKEVLHLDLDNFNNRTEKVRGGIPILYPNTGPLRNEDLYKLKQHGYARLSDQWWIEEGDGTTLSEVLRADEKTRQEYPFDTMQRVAVKLEEDGSITITQSAVNLEKEKTAPVSMGLHPYFKVKNEDKKAIKFDFVGGELIEKDFDNWSNGIATSIDNPKTKDPEALLRVTFPGLGTLVMNVSVEYRKIWVWTEPGKDFVCVEPVMRDVNGLIDDPETVKPGETFSARVNYKLE
jgi:galactose mutarotase-like enzyme